ncbi:hypothetical protein ACFONG_16860, partial [Uliginosibacterium paludis]|uniref:hypothetical protein n=1 Tax=Uliginosibacterium paludis TaxID=1615952 RepID=UPI003609DB12
RLQEDDGAAGGKAPALELAAQAGTAARAASLPAPEMAAGGRSGSARARAPGKGGTRKPASSPGARPLNTDEDWSEF